MPPPWSSAPTRLKKASAATSRRSRRRRRCTRWASTTSSAAMAKAATARDVIFFQGHAAPGIYARAYLEGRIDETHLENFRRELKPGGGLSSYPHPWLMPDFWEYPTVSMGLGPIMAIYQARFMRYLEDRGLKPASDAKVWAFLGDGETDEPEALGAITLPAREKLDNLIFVINCNLQRLDGPVRGNGQIIQELEAAFRGAGWNVIKVHLGPRVGSAAREGSRRSARQAHGRDRRRPVSEVRRRIGRLRARTLLGRRSAAARHGQAPLRRPAEEDDARRTRSDQGLQRLQGRGRAQGRADRHPRTHDQRLRPRRGGRRQEHHASTEEDERRRAAGVPHPLRHSDLGRRDRRRRRSTGRPKTASKSSTCAIGGSTLGGYVPSRKVRSEPLPAVSSELFEEFHKGHRRPQSLDDDGVRAAVVEAAPRQGAGPARRADRARRGAHVRHGGVVPRSRHLFARRPDLRAGRHGHAPLLQGSVRRPDSRRRHHRSGIDVVVHRRRHGVCDARRQHDSVLHLLLDVRLPADWRSDLGGRRRADARLPARRHRRPDDARRRRAAAPGRQQPAVRAGLSQLHQLRPGVRVRDRGHHPGRHPPDVRRSGEHLLLPDGDERAVRDAGDAGRRARRYPEGPLQVPRRRQRRTPRCGRSCSAAARSCPK